jgi:hypothetical protein
MGYRHDDEFTKKDMFVLGILFSFVVTAILGYIGYKEFHDESPQPQAAPVAVASPPPPPADAKIVAKTDFQDEIGHSFVEIDTKSGYKCFVIYYKRTASSNAAMNCQPKPVNPQSTM